MMDNTIENILRYVYENISPKIAIYLLIAFSVALFFTFSGKIEKKTEMSALDYLIVNIKKTILLAAIILTILGYLIIYSLSFLYFESIQQQQYISHINDSLISFFVTPFMYLYIIPIVGILPFSRFVILRYIKPRISATFRRWRVKQTNSSLSDIRHEIQSMKSLNYDPRKYFKDNFFFIGLDENEEPIYIPDEEFIKNHSKIPGATQKGKGVLIGLLIAQSIIKGFGTWFNDIKPDDFVYSIMIQTCKDYNLPMPIIVDLTNEFEGLGYSPFVNGSELERKQRIVKAFRIKDTGKTADHFLSINRATLYRVFDFWDGKLLHLKKLLNGNNSVFDDAEKISIRDNSINLRVRLDEWLQYKCVLADGKNNFNVKDALLNNRVVYIRGNMIDPIIKAINIALYDEVIQVALKEKLPKHTFIVWDEARFLITDLLSDSLATLLSKNVSMAITFQARKDTKNLSDPTLNVDAIQNGIETNTQQMFSYGAQDDESAKWIAEQTGEIVITTTKLESVETNDTGAEEWQGKRMVGTEKQWLITENKIKALPPRVGVFIRPNHLAQIFYTCWIPIKEPAARLIPLKRDDIEDISNQDIKARCPDNNTTEQKNNLKPNRKLDTKPKLELSIEDMEKAQALAKEKLDKIKSGTPNTKKEKPQNKKSENSTIQPVKQQDTEPNTRQETEHQDSSIILTFDNIDKI